MLNSLKQSGIDLCLVRQNIIQYIKNIAYKFTAFSDHAVLEFQVGNRMQHKGGGVWCLNASLLNDVNYRIEIYDFIKSEWRKSLDSENACVRWENLKQKMKILSIKYAKEKNSWERREYKDLQKRLSVELEEINSDPNYDLKTYLKIKADLKKYEVKRCKGAIIRSRVKHALEGEKCTSFFLSMEKQNQGRNCITELEDEKGKKVSDLVGILDTVESFYKTLFRKEGVNLESMGKVLSTVSARLSKTDRIFCDNDISLQEINEAISSLSINKSPGSDGLTGEFYRAFRDALAPILLELSVYGRKAGCA